MENKEVVNVDKYMNRKIGTVKRKGGYQRSSKIGNAIRTWIAKNLKIHDQFIIYESEYGEFLDLNKEYMKPKKQVIVSRINNLLRIMEIKDSYSAYSGIEEKTQKEVVVVEKMK